MRDDSVHTLSPPKATEKYEQGLAGAAYGPPIEWPSLALATRQPASGRSAGGLPFGIDRITPAPTMWRAILWGWP